MRKSSININDYRVDGDRRENNRSKGRCQYSVPKLRTYRLQEESIFSFFFSPFLGESLGYSFPALLHFMKEASQERMKRRRKQGLDYRHKQCISDSLRSALFLHSTTHLILVVKGETEKPVLGTSFLFYSLGGLHSSPRMCF